jgi:sterol desaturase/sphingolipid hydroxylase (fatty acid hydroxylase superfamily)
MSLIASTARVTSAPAAQAPGRTVALGAWIGVLVVLAGTIALGVIGLRDLLGGGGLSFVLRSSWAVAVGPAVLGCLALLFVLERRFPAVRRPALSRAHVTDVGYLALTAAVTIPVFTMVSVGMGVVIERDASFLVLSRYALVPRVLGAVVIVVAMDALNWACHAANHRFESFWRLHAVHHSQEDMGVFTTFRTHPLVHATYLPAALPAVMLAANGTVPAVVLAGYGVMVAFAHSNLRFTLGPLGKVLVSPAYHRLHHAVDVETVGSVNFGFVFVCWDRLAHRASYPVPGVVHPTGLAGRPVPVEQSARRGHIASVIARQLAQPFVPHFGKGTTP